jgi:hypothetical protein
MKTSIRNLPDPAQRGPAADLEKPRTRKNAAGKQVDQPAADGFDIDQSPRMVAQRAALGALFGTAAQPAATQGMALQLKREDAASGLPAAQAAPRVNRTGLPDGLKAGIESLSGLAMDGVKVHYNSDKPAQLNAFAYAQGTDIHLAPGQEQHLPHEAWHVVQQAQGRVNPTKQLHDGEQINDDKGLEREADLFGATAAAAVGQAAVQNPGLPGDTTPMVHAKGCSCPGCGQ